MRDAAQRARQSWSVCNCRRDSRPGLPKINRQVIHANVCGRMPRGSCPEFREQFRAQRWKAPRMDTFTPLSFCTPSPWFAPPPAPGSEAHPRTLHRTAFPVPATTSSSLPLHANRTPKKSRGPAGTHGPRNQHQLPEWRNKLSEGGLAVGGHVDVGERGSARPTSTNNSLIRQVYLHRVLPTAGTFSIIIEAPPA